jgi:hypothetical protein
MKSYWKNKFKLVKMISRIVQSYFFKFSNLSNAFNESITWDPIPHPCIKKQDSRPPIPAWSLKPIAEPIIAQVVAENVIREYLEECPKSPTTLDHLHNLLAQGTPPHMHRNSWG